MGFPPSFRDTSSYVLAPEAWWDGWDDPEDEPYQDAHNRQDDLFARGAYDSQEETAVGSATSHHHVALPLSAGRGLLLPDIEPRCGSNVEQSGYRPNAQ